MHSNISEIINLFSQLEVLVIGEAMLDSYLEGTSNRLCREAPVPLVNLQQRRDFAGGAANTCLNVQQLGGGRVQLLSVIGDDREGKLLQTKLERGGIETSELIVDASRQTLTKHRIFAQSQMLLRFDQGTTSVLGLATENNLIDRLAALFPSVDAVIVSDYDCGLFSSRIISHLTELQKQHSRLLVVDAKHPARYRAAGVTIVKPNYDEAMRLLGSSVGSAESESATATRITRAETLASHGETILDLTGAQIAAVTIDTEGAFLFERGRPPYRTYAHPSRHSRATGAGDTFISALALALAAGAHVPAAAELSSAAAAIVVSKEGTATCSAEELREYVSGSEKLISDLIRLGARVATYRAEGRRIVFTNGVFDILHRGHITSLNRAKTLGDVLIVGINSDSSAARLKGADRPVNSLEDRVQVLAALSCVDHIVAFETDSPIDIIRIVRPDTYAKGGDYTRETLPEVGLIEQLGGKIELLPFVEDCSTTGIINRIRTSRRATG